MEIQIKKKSKAITITVDGDLTIYEVPEFKKRFIAETADFKDIVVDVSRVSRLDTAGLQMLQLARRAAEADGKTIRFVEPSKDVQRLFSIYRENLDTWSAYGGREKTQL